MREIVDNPAFVFRGKPFAELSRKELLDAIDQALQRVRELEDETDSHPLDFRGALGER